MILTVPIDKQLWPSLGGHVCDFIEHNLVFGPGDLRGYPAKLDEEKRALVWRMYEVYPKGHPHAGRRRFKRVAISLPKGTAKTELAAWLAACELHPEAPVRCIGWSKSGEPLGGPVTDPYIPLFATTEQQSSDLCYHALMTILEEGPLRDDFDIGLERIVRKAGDGRAMPVAGSPSARDGARTTFSVHDETHWMTSARDHQGHQTNLNNIVKRKIADAWGIEITTAPALGSGSIAEKTMDYAIAVQQGRISDASLYFFHRQASDDHDLTTKAGIRAAVLEASGPATWRDIDGIVTLWNDPTADKAFLERVWLNRIVKDTTQAFDVKLWRRLAKAESPVRPGDLIVIGFDGSMFHDATALVCTHIKTGYQWLAGLWEAPYGQDGQWQVPATEVDAVVRQLFTDFTVWRMYCDPRYWETWIALWTGLFGKERVHEWHTNRRTQIAAALVGFDTAIREGTLCHSGDPNLERHIGNARRDDQKGVVKDEQGKPLWLIVKERPDSPKKIDAAMAAVLSWEARTDAIAAGVTDTPSYQVMFFGGTARRR